MAYLKQLKLMWCFLRVKYILFSTSPGGLRKASVSISGQDVYRHLKYEGGVHRVQRVPKTEKQGRIHTSTVTVAIMPQPREVCNVFLFCFSSMSLWLFLRTSCLCCLLKMLLYLTEWHINKLTQVPHIFYITDWHQDQSKRSEDWHI